jgi:carboxylesterase
MIKVKEPNPIFLENRDTQHAVLLLHSFTGTVRDVKLLATKLNKAGYTCLVPAYRGHGLMISELMQYTIQDWWQDALAGYQQLKDKGYNKITVLGVSLGGLLSLKLAEEQVVHSVVVMSTPYKKDDASLEMRLKNYGSRMGQLLGLEDVEINRQMALIPQYEAGLYEFKRMVDDIMSNVKHIDVPIAIKYGKEDELSYEKSANYIYNQIEHSKKSIIGYDLCPHLMTQGKGKAAVEEDILSFLVQFN